MIILWQTTNPVFPMPDVVSYVTSLGGFGILALVCCLWYYGKIVTRRELEAMRADRDEWKGMALKLYGFTERSYVTTKQATELAGKVVEQRAINP